MPPEFAQYPLDRDLSQAFIATILGGRHANVRGAAHGGVIVGLAPDHCRPLPYAPPRDETVQHVRVALRKSGGHLRRLSLEEEDRSIDRIRQGAGEEQLASLTSGPRVLEVCIAEPRSLRDIIVAHVIEQQEVLHATAPVRRETCWSDCLEPSIGIRFPAGCDRDQPPVHLGGNLPYFDRRQVEIAATISNSSDVRKGRGRAGSETLRLGAIAICCK
jgi:hypothetical protein